MIKKYIIDGNNLMGKIPEFRDLQKAHKQNSREKLAFYLERYFFQKKVAVSLHFDGHPGDPIRADNLKIVYSFSKSADSEIKREISESKNPKVIAVVSSDMNVMEFARVNACKVIKCEKFISGMKSKSADDEHKRIEQIDENEIKKIFGVEE